MEEKELNMLKEFNFNPLAPKQLSDTIKLLVTVAKSEPDAEKSKLQLSEIYSYLTNSEDIVTSLLNSIRTSKTYTMKELNNRIIDGHQVTFGDTQAAS